MFSPTGTPVPEPVWWAWLEALDPTGCLFATAPDAVVVAPDGTVFGDPVATWERSEPYLARIRQLGIPAALVAQPGFEAMSHDWSAFDVVFLGGDNAWKDGAGAARTVELAKAHGKWVHMGRVNTRTRLRWAAQIGCDSADGTMLRFPDAKLPCLVRWLDELAAERAQGALFAA